MKTIVLFILYINYVTCFGENGFSKVKKVYPKKVKPDVNGHIQILNARKYLNADPIEFKLATKKKDESNHGYTVFQVINKNNEKAADIPGSSYFSPRDNISRKVRDKRVLHPRKFIKANPTVIRLATKKNNENNQGYTAFPIIKQSGKKLVNVPDSPYFPLNDNIDQKVRVKKVLPEYMGSIRKKRSAVDDENKNNKNVKAVKNKKKSAKKSQSETQKHDKNKAAKKKNNAKKGKQQKSNLRYTKRHGKKVLRSKTGRTSPTKTKLPRNQKRKVNGRRLIAARDALIEDYPYVVSIQKGGEHWCAGALLNPRLVITTANCVWKSNRLSRMKVRAGSRHTQQGGQVAKIQEVMKHPGWSIRSNPDYDVALLLLDRNIKFSDSVHGADLPNRVMMPAFEDAWVTSFGAERRDGIYSNGGMTLQVYHARLMNREKCNNATMRFGVSVSENFFCMAQTGKRAPCTRDTGAPAVSDGVVWGLASWGIRKLCGTDRFPAMFSYLASPSNMDFIMNATRVLMADERIYQFADRFPYVPPSTTTSTASYLPF